MKTNTKKTISFYIKHIKRYKSLTALMLTTITFAVSISMITPILYREFVDLLIQGGEKEIIMKGLFTVIIYIGITEFTSEIFWRISGFSTNRFQPKIMGNILNECFEYMQKHSYNFFNSNFSGALVKRVNRMAKSFGGVADLVYWDTIPLVIRGIIIFVVLSFLHPLLGGVIFAWIAIFVIISLLIARYKMKFELRRTKADTKITATLADAITNNSNIKLFSAIPYEKGRFQRVTGDWSKKTTKAWDIDSIIVGIQAFLMIVLEIGIMVVATLLWSKGKLVAADFVLIQTYLISLFMNLWELGRIIRSLYTHFADAEEMTIILNTPHDIKDKKNAGKLEVSRGKVEFRNVKFAYDKGSDVIKKLSFKVKPGEKVALIGPSGGGKSTISKLLLRLFDIKKGEILIDNQNISNVTQHSLRKEVSLVPQDPILFHRTIRENIRYGRRDATNEEIIAAAKMAHCHEFIEKLPKGYETYVGERGVKLSGGERQRVAIARAILSNTKILILDEATSQLDSESEKLIQDALENLMKNKTTFIIAHRLSTIMQADKVLVLQDGKIVEEGTHANLVGKKNGLYQKLWDLQVGGYVGE